MWVHMFELHPHIYLDQVVLKCERSEMSDPQTALSRCFHNNMRPLGHMMQPYR